MRLLATFLYGAIYGAKCVLWLTWKGHMRSLLRIPKPNLGGLGIWCGSHGSDTWQLIFFSALFYKPVSSVSAVNLAF